MIDLWGFSPQGGAHPWAGGPGLCRKPGWASRGEEASELCFSMTSTSPPTLQITALTSSGMECVLRVVRWNNPFLPMLLLATVFTTDVEPLSRTPGWCMSSSRAITGMNGLWTLSEGAFPTCPGVQFYHLLFLWHSPRLIMPSVCCSHLSGCSAPERLLCVLWYFCVIASWCSLA